MQKFFSPELTDRSIVVGRQRIVTKSRTHFPQSRIYVIICENTLLQVRESTVHVQ